VALFSVEIDRGILRIDLQTLALSHGALLTLPLYHRKSAHVANYTRNYICTHQCTWKANMVLFTDAFIL
jgi:hypothetical protein